MMYMQSNILTQHQQRLTCELQSYPSLDCYHALLGIAAEFKGNVLQANEHYRSSNHPVAIERYLAINQLKPLAFMPNICFQVHDQAQVNIQYHEAPVPAVTPQSDPTSPTMTITPKETKKQAKENKIPKISASAYALMLEKELVDFLKILNEINGSAQWPEKLVLAKNLSISFKELESKFQRCKKRGLVTRWPKLTNYGREVLQEYEKLQAAVVEQAPSKAEVAKAVINMYDLKRKKQLEKEESEMKPLPCAPEKLAIKFILS
jgi:hypothetical protein